MSSIGKRLLASTADLAAAVAAKSVSADPAQPAVPRTAPGQMLAARSEMLSMQSELAALRERLQRFDGSLPTLKLDPNLVRPTRWANRHERSFTSPGFARLKASIESGGGNTQPILVRPADEPGVFELVFGHRRHRACQELGLPVLAVLWNGPMSDIDLFLSMDRENREREDPSPFEQGATYLAAMEAGMFPSQRRLAEATGVSHTWVRKALLVAQLPPAIIEAFGSPLEIQPKHAEAISLAMEHDRKAVVRRAEKLRQMPKRPGPAQVVAALVGSMSGVKPAEKLRLGTRTIGNWRVDNKGRAIITVEAAHVDEDTMAQLSAAITKVIAGREKPQAE